MKIFKDLSPSAGHSSIQSGFIAVVKHGKSVMNGRSEWALHELEMDDEDKKWLFMWAENLEEPATSNWLQTDVRLFDEDKLKHPAAFGTLLLLQAIEYAVEGLPQPNGWPLPVKFVFPKQVWPLFFDEDGNDDEPSDYYLRSLILAVKKLKIRQGVSVDTKKWLRETIAMQVSPEVASHAETPNWISRAQNYVLEQLSEREVVNPAIVNVVPQHETTNDIDIVIKPNINDLFPDIEPDAGAAIVEKAALKILRRASEQDIIHKPWSLAELYPTDIDYVWLRIWVKNLDANTVRYCLGQSHRFTWNGREYPFQAALGLVLLLWISEEARRKASEGWLWKWIPQDAFRPEVRQILFTQGNPSGSLKEIIEIAARRFNLRHVFGVEGTQQWIDTVFLQFGFTKRGMEARLPYWLAGQLPPFAVKRLLEPATESGKFTELWKTLRNYRQKNITREQADKELQDNPWILPDWIPSMVRTAVQSIDQDEESKEVEDIDAQTTLVSRPLFQWNPPIAPCFVCKLTDLSLLDLTEDVYTVDLNGQIIDQLNRQPDGSYKPTSNGEIKIEMASSRSVIKIIGENGEVMASQGLELWPPDEDIVVFRISNGNIVNDPYTDALSPQAAYAILTPPDLQMEPPPHHWEAGQGYKISYMNPIWDANTKIYLNQFVIWEPVIKIPAPPDPIAAKVLCQLEGLHPQALIRWGESISIKATHPPDASITFVRYNGKAVNFHKINDNSIKIGQIRVEPNITNDLLEFKIGLLYQGEKITITKQVGVNLIGVAKLNADGWTALNDQFKLRTETARKAKFKIKPPKFWDGQENKCSEWALMEGDLWGKRLSCNQSTIGKVSGWGAPMTLRLGPYNAEKDAMQIARSVIDRGVISNVEFGSGLITLNLLNELDVGDRYSIVIWDKNGAITRCQPEHGANNRQWACQSNLVMDDVMAVGISHEGWRLGTWWKHDWASALANATTNDTELAAGMIRWLHLPILSPKYIDHVRQVSQQYPAEFLTTWLQNELPGMDLQVGELDEGWLAAVRNIFIDWNPDAANVDQIISGLSDAFDMNVKVSEASWGMLKVDPRLLYKILKNWTALQTDQVAAKLIIKNVCLQIAEAKDDADFKAKREVLISDSAKEWGVDAFFINNGIVQKAVISAQGNIITRRDEMNIALAISSETLRRLLAISLINLIA